MKWCNDEVELDERFLTSKKIGYDRVKTVARKIISENVNGSINKLLILIKAEKKMEMDLFTKKGWNGMDEDTSEFDLSSNIDEEDTPNIDTPDFIDTSDV